MKITKIILALFFVCCGTTIPLSADTSNSKEYKQIANEISKIEDLPSNPVIRQFAIQFVEKNIKKIIKSKERSIKHCVESIENDQENLDNLKTGKFSDWIISEEDAKYFAEAWKNRIEKDHEKILKFQEDIKVYEALLKEVQSLT